MAKKKTQTVRQPVEKPRLDLKQILYSLDSKNRNFYKNLSEEDKKQYVPFVLMRFLSSTPDQSGCHDYHIHMVNELINQNFWMLNKHPELCHLLMTAIGTGQKQYHPWIAGPKKRQGEKIFELFQQQYPGLNEDEFAILLASYDSHSFKEYCQQWGMEDQQVKQYAELFNKLTS
jgi:hypothetical protein